MESPKKFVLKRQSPSVKRKPMLFGKKLPKHLVDNVIGGVIDSPYFDEIQDCLSFLKSGVKSPTVFFIHGNLRPDIEKLARENRQFFFEFIGLGTDFRTPQYRVQQIIHDDK